MKPMIAAHDSQRSSFTDWLHQAVVIGRARRSLGARRMSLAVTIQANHRTARQQLPDGLVRGYCLETRRAAVTLEAVVVIEAAAEADRLGIGSRRVAGEVAKSFHLRCQVAVQPVGGMAVI